MDTKFKMMRRRTAAKRRGFTLVEMLAAMAFMAIVIPVVMQAMGIANKAGQVAQRKAIAANYSSPSHSRSLSTPSS